MSFWSTRETYSGNPDKEAMLSARRALRDQCISELNALKHRVNQEETPCISILKVRCENLKHSCAKYLVYTSWMKNLIGGSIIHSVYPDTKEEVDAYIESVYKKRECDMKHETWKLLYEGYDYFDYCVIENRAEWWDSIYY